MNFRVPNIIWLIIHLNYLIVNKISWILNLQWLLFLYLTWWFLANEILNTKQPLQTALPSKAIHNFCQGPKEGTLEQPGEKAKKWEKALVTIWCTCQYIIVSLVPSGLVKHILSDTVQSMQNTHGNNKAVSFTSLYSPSV